MRLANDNDNVRAGVRTIAVDVLLGSSSELLRELLLLVRRHAQRVRGWGVAEGIEPTQQALRVLRRPLSRDAWRSWASRLGHLHPS